VQLAHSLPTQYRSGLWCSLGMCAPAADVGFLWLVLSVWPLQSGHRVQHLFVHVSAFVVCVAIAKWSQGAAVVCSCVRLGQPFFPLVAALKGPLLPLLSRGCHKPCPRPSFQPACGPSCCGAVRGLTLCCSCWALASSWSPFVPVSFFEVGADGQPPCQPCCTPSLACGSLLRSSLFAV
jgi:hypothetical protein